jgi:hypothetical protein
MGKPSLRYDILQMASNIKHLITSNEGFFHTHEGIDVLGTHLADEV